MWVVATIQVTAQVNRKICISVDDLPVVSYGIDHENRSSFSLSISADWLFRCKVI